MMRTVLHMPKPWLWMRYADAPADGGFRAWRLRVADHRGIRNSAVPAEPFREQTLYHRVSDGFG